MKTTIKLVLIYFAYQLVFGAAMMGLTYVWPIGQTAMLAWSLLLSGVAMTVHLAAFGYIDLRRALRPVGADALLCSTVCVVGGILFCNALSGFIILPDWLKSDFTALSHSVLGIFCIALLAPWVEELLFRGVILQRLNRGRKSPWRGIVISALVFGLIHVNPAQVFFAFLMGLVLGWITVQTHSLVPAIVGHVLNNSLSVAELVAIDGSHKVTDYTILPISTLLMTAFSGLLMIIVTGWQLTQETPLDIETENNLNNTKEK